MKTKTHWYITSFNDVIRKPINSRKKRTLYNSSLKYCIECKKTWQHDWIGGNKKFIQYEDMPSYKLKREKCDKCNT